MIKLIEHEHELDRVLLNKTLSGKKMLAYMRAYGPNYEFCRFYKITDGIGTGFMFIINSTLIICGDGKLEPNDEIDLFVSMNLPFRIEGDQKILEGINIPDRYICSAHIHSAELGYNSMMKLLKLKERPTAILTTNYEVSLGVIMALNEQGIRCPEDISLIGFDELILPMVMNPKLTLVAQPMEEIAAEGARILLKRIEEGGSFPPQRVSLYASLKEGKSVRSIKVN